MDNNQELHNIIDQLEKNVDSLSTHLAEQFYQVIKMLANVVGMQDKYHEGSHSRYVSNKSEELAVRLGMEEDEVFEIKVAGLLHDIGKIGLKEAHLTKFTTEMQENEFLTYIAHSMAGWEILRHYEGFVRIAELVFQHHERLDGSGYPRRLSGKQILPGAAILSIVDTYHNSMYRIRRDRFGKTGSTMDFTSTATYLEQTQSRYISSMNLLISKSGIWFDRKAVDTFLSIIEEERRDFGVKNIVRLPVNKLERGMIFAEDYTTKYGLLIAARGESITDEDLKALIRFAESDQLPQRILVIK